jgi:adenosylhomocysteine nucleosidase
MARPLYVFALEAETQGLFDTRDHLYTGVGKVQASYALTRRLRENRPSLIVNLGTAGCADPTRHGTVVCCRRFLQRDMDATSLGFGPGETPFAGTPAVLEYGLAIDGVKEAVCGTGDSFVTTRGGLEYDIVDMEAYALAYVAMKENIPFACLKYISDGADRRSPGDWSRALHDAAYALSTALSRTRLC